MRILFLLKWSYKPSQLCLFLNLEWCLDLEHIAPSHHNPHFPSLCVYLEILVTYHSNLDENPINILNSFIVVACHLFMLKYIHISSLLQITLSPSKTKCILTVYNTEIFYVGERTTDISFQKHWGVEALFMGITLLVVVSLGHSRELGFKWLALRPVFPEVRKLNNLPFRNSC